MLLIDREIKIRKELFGLELFDILSETEENETDGKKGIKKRISQTLSGVTQHEKDIQFTIDQFKKDISAIQERIRSKHVSFKEKNLWPRGEKVDSCIFSDSLCFL